MATYKGYYLNELCLKLLAYAVGNDGINYSEFRDAISASSCEDFPIANHPKHEAFVRLNLLGLLDQVWIDSGEYWLHFITFEGFEILYDLKKV